MKDHEEVEIEKAAAKTTLDDSQLTTVILYFIVFIITRLVYITLNTHNMTKVKWTNVEYNQY